MTHYILQSRRAAADAGESKFYTGIPCKYGHLAQRWVASGGCCACSRNAAAAWQRAARGDSYRFVRVRVPNQEAQRKVEAYATQLCADFDKAMVQAVAMHRAFTLEEIAARTQLPTQADADRTLHMLKPVALPQEEQSNGLYEMPTMKFIV